MEVSNIDSHHIPGTQKHNTTKTTMPSKPDPIDMISTRDDALTGFQYYHYVPSKTAATISTLLFVVLTLVHFYQMCRTRVWFMVPLVIGGLCESPPKRGISRDTL